MSRYLGIVLALGTGLLFLFLFSKTANHRMSDMIVKLRCQPGSEKSCHSMGVRSVRSNKTRYLGAKALATNCNNNGAVASCLPAAQAWEVLEELDAARDSYEVGCYNSDSQACFEYYMFLTRNSDYVADARSTMESVCAAGHGDHSACVFTTIVFEEEGRIADALNVVKAMCDLSPSAPECWSTAEFFRASGDILNSARYYYMACKMGEARACQAYSDVYAMDLKAIAQGSTNSPSFQNWVKQALVDIEKFNALVEKNPNTGALSSLEAYLQKWKYYGQSVALVQPQNAELARAKTLFQQSMHDFDLVTQLIIRSVRGGTQLTSQKYLRIALDDAFSKGAEVEKVLARYPASR